MRSLSLTIATALALALAPGSSSAQGDAPSADDIEKAKAAFVEGKSLYDAGDKREAVARFKESYRLSRNALLLYNIGLTYDELGEVDLAIFYYDKFLSDTDRKVANRGLAQRRLKELRKEAERKRAAEAERAARGGDEDESAADADADPEVERPEEGMLHRIIEDAPPRKPVDITAVIPEGRAWKASLFYRSAGASEFEEVAMEPRYRELVGRIPAAAVVGTSLQYYIEMRDDLGQVVASSGKKTSPNIVLIDESAQARFYPDVDAAIDDEEPALLGGGSNDPARDDAGGDVDYALWGTTGGSIALLAIATGTYFVAASRSSALEDEAAVSRNPDRCEGQPLPCGQFGNYASDLESTGQTLETVHTVTLIGGVALAGAAGYLWYRAKQSDDPSSDDSALTVIPVVGTDLIGGAAAVRF